MTTKQEIELINTIIREAISHGGDAGGSYNSNKKKLTAAIEAWLNEKYLQGMYTVRPTYSDETGEYPLQIVPTEDGEKEEELNEIINRLEKFGKKYPDSSFIIETPNDYVKKPINQVIMYTGIDSGNVVIDAE